MTVRHMKVVRTPGTTDTPMVKIANQMLEAMEFTIGTTIEVTYQQGIISIRKVNEKYEPNNLQGQPVSPVSHPGASDAVHAEESAGHTGRGTSDPRSSPEALWDVRSLRHVFGGYFHSIHRQNAGTGSRAVHFE
ncbi:hypothetical protein A2880_03395 [Candidatus Peribacteria bacterium RIFCSPHIGHO2_01_FULL_49_38]|nr:MAG: hypothetical protein A2880_03395 [Candidatus Peribacteria bacterium RIFCSPHIGHO2_01_FULL_49_38]